jgi:PPOX class probable F420-dependent enzyme
MQDYGIAQDEEGQLPWSWAEEQLAASRNYWICTTRPDGRPHAMPVWGVWVDGAVYFSTGRQTVKARNLAANPALTVHLESGDECVVLEGRAEVVSDAAALGPADAAYAAKYQDAQTGEPYHLIQPEPSDSPIFRVRPAVAFGWHERDFPQSATRWRFGQ